jgi:hypothetical protein
MLLDKDFRRARYSETWRWTRYWGISEALERQGQLEEAVLAIMAAGLPFIAASE